jgi:hypothetical protein
MAIHSYQLKASDQSSLLSAGINIDSAVNLFVFSRITAAQQLQLSSAFQVLIVNKLPFSTLSVLNVPIAITIPIVSSIGNFTLSVDQETILQVANINIDLDVNNYIQQLLTSIQLLSYRTAYANVLVKDGLSSSFKSVTPNFIIPS